MRDFISAQGQQTHIVVECNQIFFVIGLAFVHELQYPALLLHILHLHLLSCLLFLLNWVTNIIVFIVLELLCIFLTIIFFFFNMMGSLKDEIFLHRFISLSWGSMSFLFIRRKSALTSLVDEIFHPIRKFYKIVHLRSSRIDRIGSI